MAINSLLATGLTEFLDCEKYGRIGFNSGNSCNGEFKQQTVAPYKRSNDTLLETVIHLFKKGLTMSEIANLIEMKKYTKRKEQFPNEESLERFLVTQFEDYNQRFATHCHIGFNQARAKLEEMFEQLNEPVK